jgi:hypothetical protein
VDVHHRDGQRAGLAGSRIARLIRPPR